MMLQTTAKEWLFFLLGALLGYIINVIFYLKSRNDKSEKNFDRLVGLYENVIRQPTNNVNIEKLKDDIPNQYSIEQLNNEIAKIKARLAKNQNSEDVIRYKFLGDKWSEEYVKTTNPNILTKDGLLFYTNILEFHKTIFPPDFPWSGKIRTQDVVIQGSFGTVMPSRTESTVENSLEPIPKDDVLNSMERLCNSWNTNINRLRTETAEIKLESIARYHHKFQMIHPFIDGNGRVGRVILSDMSEYLLNRSIDPDFNREEYYSALHLADMGKFEPLSEVIYKQLKT